MADAEAKKPAATTTQKAAPAPAEEAEQPYVLGKIDWAAIGAKVEEHLKENKVWLEVYYRYPDHLLGPLYNAASQAVVEALPSQSQEEK